MSVSPAGSRRRPRPSLGSRKPISLHKIHRAPERRGRRTIGRQRRRQLRQCARRDDQRTLQSRGHLATRDVAQLREVEFATLQFGRLVQQQEAAGADRKHSTGRSEARYYAQMEEPHWRRDSNEIASGKPGAVHGNLCIRWWNGTGERGVRARRPISSA